MIQRASIGDDPALIAHKAATTESGVTRWTVAEEHAARLAAFVRTHYPFVWRVLRRYGLSAEDADDGAQQVFMVVAHRLQDIRDGSERPFLYRTAMHVGLKARRSHRRRPEVVDNGCAEATAALLMTDDLVEQHRARALLDQMLQEMPPDLRAVLVLFELEELTKTEVSDALGIPAGTVASRLRRARKALEALIARRQARLGSKGGWP